LTISGCYGYQWASSANELAIIDIFSNVTTVGLKYYSFKNFQPRCNHRSTSGVLLQKTDAMIKIPFIKDVPDIRGILLRLIFLFVLLCAIGIILEGCTPNIFDSAAH
jgi:hypothetical protein